MRVMRLSALVAAISSLTLLSQCQATPPRCSPLYVTEYSNRNAKIDIRVPGRYCLMTDLHARFDFADHPAEGRQIHIWTSNVELDLMGHTLGRGRFFVQPGDIGIEIQKDAKNVVIKNGKLKDFSIGVYRYRLYPGEGRIRATPISEKTRYVFRKDHIILENILFQDCKTEMLFYDSEDDSLNK